MPNLYLLYNLWPKADTHGFGLGLFEYETLSGEEDGRSPGENSAANARPNWIGCSPDRLSAFGFPLTFLVPVLSTVIETKSGLPWILHSRELTAWPLTVGGDLRYGIISQKDKLQGQGWVFGLVCPHLYRDTTWGSMMDCYCCGKTAISRRCVPSWTWHAPCAGKQGTCRTWSSNREGGQAQGRHERNCIVLYIGQFQVNNLLLCSFGEPKNKNLKV